ncbi:MAG: hypothetical protein LBG75_00385 [Candidatus Nomurabacteria bacterium]|jgi:hypothetical protein|nr:hypothetical protein [Candidatus Nomurabacteria bacterium]
MKNIIQKTILVIALALGIGALSGLTAPDAYAADKYTYTCQTENKSTYYVVTFYKNDKKQSPTYGIPSGKKCTDAGGGIKAVTKKTTITKANVDKATKNILKLIDEAEVAAKKGSASGSTGTSTTGTTSSGGAKDGCSQTSVIVVNCDDQGGGIFAILNIVLNIMTVGVGILALVGVTLAAFTYTTAGGSMEKVQKSKERILQVVIGIIAWGVLYVVLQFLIPGGVFK